MPDAPQARRLAAILAADIAGYSALSERDAAQAIADVARLRERARTACEAHSGRIFNTAGDGIMLEFASATDALAAAFHLSDVSQDAKLRIGVHMGEVTPTENNDLLGHGVNVAARLQAEAIAGGVMVSQVVYESVAPELASRLTARGRVRLLKMRETVRVYGFDPTGGARAPAANPIIAVLAF